MDSLKKRYFIKLVKSSSDALINVSLLLFVPRVLGPAAYGSFNFIRESFQNIIALSDLNLGAAHINHAARKEKSDLASNVYFTYTLLVGFGVLVFVIIANLTGLSRYVFPGQSQGFLLLGALLAYLMYLFSASMGLSDSKGATYGFELRSITVSIVMFFILVTLYFTDTLTLTTFFTQRIMLHMVLLAFGVWYLHRKIQFSPRIVSIRHDDARGVIKEFFAFSHPLIVLSVVSILFSLFDRWFLQVIYGSVSQGYFSLAFAVSSIAGLFLKPMTPLLMQSVAKADENGDLQGVRDSFEKVKILSLIGTFLSIYFMFHTAEIIGLIGGEEYNAASFTVLVMFLYPIHVVYGQFCGGVLIALRKTALYRDIALISSVVGVLITYILLAPRSFPIPGLELDSLGLALKLVLIQFFSVTIQLYFVCRLVGERMQKYLLSQFIIPIPLIVVGVSEQFLRSGFSIHVHGVTGIGLSLGVSMLLWIIAIGSIVWCFPTLVGLNKSVLHHTGHQAVQNLSRRGS